MGEAEGAIYWTGCPSVDLAAGILDSPGLDFDPYTKYGGVGPTPDLTAGYVVVMQHPVTTEHDQAARHVEETLHSVCNSGLPALWFWPNVDAGSDGTSRGIRKFREMHAPDNIHFFKNMKPLDFLRLLRNCRCLVGNSSVGIRECAFLGVPVVNIGSRQSDRERGPNVVDVDYSRAAIAEAIRHQVDHGAYPQDDLYGDGRAGRRIARLLATAPLTSAKRFVEIEQSDLPDDQRPGKLRIHRAA
jgi:UDP-hydrolysing UDP-N-acetyl-D-glucosamine 2-epimerase